MINSGDYNSGHRNSGYSNSGHSNSGNYNSGNYNSGHNNSGYSNSGHRNSGDCNSGDCNSGHNNSGHNNSGDCNSGDYNSGNGNSGFFNTNEPTVRLFNKDTNLKRSDIDLPYIHLKLNEWIDEDKMTISQKVDNPNFYITKGILITRTYKEAWQLVWPKLDQKEKQKFLDLPNFDADIFLEITGIDVKKQSCAGKIVEIDGKKYKLQEI